MRIKLQFSLRWFLLATTLIAVLIGTVGKRAYDQWRNHVALEGREQAIRELEDFGVRASKKYYRAENREGEIARLQFPTQVCKPRHFQLAAEIGDLEWLDLDYTAFRDSDAPTLDAHPNLKRLTLGGNPGVTDESLKSIARLPSLEFLDLSETGVSDQGLQDVARLPNLQSLYLTKTGVTSSGLVHLRPLQSLRNLRLILTKVDDEGLEAIGELHSLEILCLDHTEVRGTGLAALAKLPKLQFLHLRGCSLEDGSGLAKLKQVTHLEISETRISPGILSYVHQMDNLIHLNLRDSEINDEHLSELARATQLTILLLGKANTPGGPVYPQDIAEPGLMKLRAALPNTRIVGIPGDP